MPAAAATVFFRRRQPDTAPAGHAMRTAQSVLRELGRRGELHAQLAQHAFLYLFPDATEEVLPRERLLERAVARIQQRHGIWAVALAWQRQGMAWIATTDVFGEQRLANGPIGIGGVLWRQPRVRRSEPAAAALQFALLTRPLVVAPASDASG